MNNLNNLLIKYTKAETNLKKAVIQNLKTKGYCISKNEDNIYHVAKDPYPNTDKTQDFYEYLDGLPYLDKLSNCNSYEDYNYLLEIYVTHFNK